MPVKPHPRSICIHGHFYQPPRENPWLEAIERQESAYPYHDWNERITAECYGPNARCRVLDAEGRIDRIVNNYSRMSFNFGPTLLSWLEANARRCYEAILQADRDGRERFNGHGPAMAQVYNHIIMPLASTRDKITQVAWGLADFESRFGRPAEGMWLAETAVDTETLDILADHGVLYTVLSPYQAAHVRFLGEDTWHNVDGGRIDPTRPYECHLPSGRSITLFFYDGPISRAIAFEKLLVRGEYLVDRLMGAFTDNGRDWPQLVHIATDGETYGHHHTFADMALAAALDQIERRDDVRLTVYGEYLAEHPPTHAVEIHEASAWSCSHGVGRWKEHCGCNMGGGHGRWTQEWRGPLREAFDWLRDEITPRYEKLGKRIWSDPWAARDGYIEVMLDRSPESRKRFFRRFTRGKGSARGAAFAPPEETTALKLLEMQRHLMLMYTSCGWFFDELSGIETVQTIQYAARAIQLAEDLFGEPLEEAFLERLAKAPSNIPDHKDGRRIYEKFVRPARVDLAKAASHYAISSLFETYPQRVHLHCYTAEAEELYPTELGRAKLLIGRATITSEITGESEDFSFASVHLGDHNLHGGVRPFRSEQEFRRLREDMALAFGRADFPALVVTLSKHFGDGICSLQSLFRDEQRKILERLLKGTADSLDGVYRQMYEQHALMMRFLLGLDAPLPKPFVQAAEFILTHDLRWALIDDEPDLDRIRGLLLEAKMWRVHLDAEGLGYEVGLTLARLVERSALEPTNPAIARLARGLVALIDELPFDVDFWKAQNLYHDALEDVLPATRQRAAMKDPQALAWVREFEELGRALNMRVPEASGS